MFSNFALVFRSIELEDRHQSDAEKKDHTIHCETESLYCGDSPLDVVVLAYLYGIACNRKRHAQVCLYVGRDCHALLE